MYIHNGILSDIMNGVMSFAGKWIQVETIIVSKLRQPEKDKYPLFPHLWFLDAIYALKSGACVWHERKNETVEGNKG